MTQLFSQKEALILIFVCSVIALFMEAILWSTFFTHISPYIPSPSFITTTGALSLTPFLPVAAC